MDGKLAVKILLVSIVAIASITAVYAATQKGCEGYIQKPAQGVSVNAFTEGISFIMAGGIGPLLILVLAFVIGFLISHLVWSSF